jgi:hypothetical protein
MSEKTTLETLRQMTGAPEEDEPLVSDTPFDPAKVKSARPTWKMPIPKLLVIGVALVPVFGAAGYFLVSGQQVTQTEPETTDSKADGSQSDNQESDLELEQAQAEIAQLKSQMALDDQAYIQQQTRTAASKAPAQPTAQSMPEQPTTSKVTSPPATSSSQVRSSPPPTVRYQPPPRPIQTSVPAARTAPMPNAPSPRFTETDPTERWQQLARLGSYGTVSPLEETEPAGMEQYATRESIPVAHIAPTSAIPTFSSQASTPSESPMPEVETPDSTVSDPVLIAANKEDEDTDLNLEPEVKRSPPADILHDAEAQILAEPLQPPALISGTQASGHLTTPVILNAPEQSNRYSVQLSEPLMDNRGRVAIPAGSELLIQIDAVGSDRLVQLSAVAAIWEENGYQREVILPDQVIQIRGAGGHPLIAQGYGDRGGEIAAMDASEFALGAISRAAELYTRPNSRVQTNNSSTVITEENPAPNILAGALEGGTDALLDTLSERNQRAREELEARPQVLYLDAGTPVQIFVNTSMQLPM